MSFQTGHTHQIVSAPPKLSVSQLMGILKRIIEIKIFKSYPHLKKKPFWGNHFGPEDIVMTKLVLTRTKPGSLLSIRKSKNE